jgi:hypothetical protein
MRSATQKKFNRRERKDRRERKGTNSRNHLTLTLSPEGGKGGRDDFHVVRYFERNPGMTTAKGI